ncbi:MAG: molybdopterin dinucleotide binding domain-containing protein [Candidatus Sericytochromatia bacterium]|nr:molybdopterin dinucleotide binding domain-containing protein [Candidatus Sericytochromatia bacterium]
MERREFLKLSGLAGTALVLGGCEDYNSQLVAYVDRPISLEPGEGNHFATTCDMCASGCAVSVRVVEGRTVKVEGLEGHPLSRGGLCALGQAGVQHQYHPDRFRGPDLRSKAGEVSADYLKLKMLGDEAFRAMKRPTTVGENFKVGITSFAAPDFALADAKWAETRKLGGELWTAAADRLGKVLSEAGAGAVIVLGPQVRGHRYQLVAQAAKAFGAPAPVIVEPFGYEVLRAANQAVYGRPDMPYVDLANTELALCFGEEPFTTGPAPTLYNWGFGEMRRGRELVRGLFVVVSTRMGEAAAIADLWIPVRPGTHGVIAQLALHAMGKGGVTVAEAHEKTGAPVERLEKFVRWVSQIDTKVAFGGGEVLGHTNAVETLTLVNGLNVAAGMVGRKGGILPAAPAPITGMAPPAPLSFKQLLGLVDQMKAGKVKALVAIGVDLFMALPGSAGLEDALKSVPEVVSFATVPDDTAALATMVLPDSTFLERWGDATPSVGSGSSVATLMQPLVVPFFETRSAEDVLIAASKAAGKDLGFPSAEAYFKAKWAGVANDSQVPGAQSAWKKALRNGGIHKPALGAPLAAKMPPANLAAPKFEGDDNEFPFVLQPVKSVKYREGQAAHLPWLQEMADPMSAAAWGGWLELNPHTMEKLGVAQYDEVLVKSPFGEVKVGVVPYPGLPEDVVGMPLNFSRNHGTRYDSVEGGSTWEATMKKDPGRGQDARALLGAKAEPVAGGLAWGSVRVSVTPTGAKSKRLVLVSKSIQPQESPAVPARVEQEFKVWPIS